MVLSGKIFFSVIRILPYIKWAVHHHYSNQAVIISDGWEFQLGSLISVSLVECHFNLDQVHSKWWIRSLAPPRCLVEFHVTQLETRAGAACRSLLRRKPHVPWCIQHSCGNRPWISRYISHINLVGGWNMDFIFPIILGMSSSQLTNSIIFQRGRSTTNQLIIYYMGTIFWSLTTIWIPL